MKNLLKLFLLIFIFLSSVQGAFAQCVGSTTSVSGYLPSSVGCGTSGSIQWDGASGGTIDGSGNVTWTTTGTFRLKRQYFNPGGCSNHVDYRYTPYYTITAKPSGPSATELTQELQPGQVILKYTGSVTNTFWQDGASGTVETYQTNRTVTQTGTYYARIKASSVCWSDATSITVSSVPSNETPTGQCVNNVTSVSGYLPSSVGCGTSGSIEWDGSDGGDIDGSGNVTWTTTGTFRLRRQYFNSGSCTNFVSYRYTPYFTITSQPAGPSSISELTQEIQPGQVLLKYTGSANNIFWQDGQNGTVETYNTTRTITQANTYYARKKIGSECWSTASASVVTSVPANESPTGQCVNNVTSVSSYLPSSVTCGTSGSIEWDGADGGDIDGSGNITWTTTGTFRLKRQYFNSGSCTNHVSYRYSPYYTIASQPSGPLSTELTQEVQPGQVALKYTGSVSSTFWQDGENGKLETYQTNRNVTQAGTYYARIKAGSQCWSTATALTVSSVPASETPAGQCVNNVTPVSGYLPSSVGCGTSGSIEWDGSDGGDIDGSGNVTWTTTGTFRLRRQYFNSGSCTNFVSYRYTPYFTIASQPAGPSASELTQELQPGQVVLKYTGSATNIFWQDGESGTVEFYQTTRTVTDEDTYYARIKAGSQCWSAATAITVSDVPSNETPTGQCVNNVTSVSGYLPSSVGCGTSGSIEWDGSDGGDIDGSGNVTWTTTGTFRLRRQYFNPSGCSNHVSYRYTPYYTIGVQPAGPSLSEIAQTTKCGQVTLQYTGSSDNAFWQTSSNGTDQFYESTKVVTETGYYYARIKHDIECWSLSTQTTVTVPQTPETVVPFVDYDCSKDGINVTLISDDVTDRWYESFESATPITASNSVLTSKIPKTLYLERNIPGICLLRTTYEVDNTFDIKCGQPLNAIKTTRPLEPIEVISSTDDLVQGINYFDGLGRVIQQTSIKGSPSEKDIVTPVVYDKNGRTPVQYLPYVTASGDGLYKQSPVAVAGAYDNSPHHQFYTSNNSEISRDSIPFSVTLFESSPLNRVIKQGAPGASWQPDDTHNYTSTDHSIKKKYELNDSTEVLLWTHTAPTTSYPFGQVSAGSAAAPVNFDANKLFKNKTKDEEGVEVIEYVDQAGRTLLKRVQANSSTSINDTNYASTYYIYDAFDNLVCVLPPEATKRLSTEYFHSSATDATKEIFLKKWTFRYAYDGRKRMIQKQVPGADPVYMVYDDHDRLVLAQDANQRNKNQWLFTKYDNLNRPVITGIYTALDFITRDSMQSVVNSFYSGIGTPDEWYESSSVSGRYKGYTNRSFPKGIAAGDLLTVTYYDNYSFKNSLIDSARYSFNKSALPQQDSSYLICLRGQVTGSMVKVLNGGATGYTWLATVNYYDDRYRVIQSISDNDKNGTDRSTTIYDFTGKILTTRIAHIANDLNWSGLVGIQKIGDEFKRTAAGSSWSTSGAASAEALPASTDGWLSFAMPQDNKQVAVGFSTSNLNANWTSIKYAFFINSDFTFQIREDGSTTNLLTAWVPYDAGDIFTIQRKSNKIKYYKNDSLLLERNVISGALLADLAISTTEGKLSGFTSSFGSQKLHTTTRRFVYDHAGRLQQIFHKLDNNDEILLVESRYNELGQLITKDLHGEDNRFIQQADYRYNIRGWLSRINNSDLTKENQNDASEPRDFFGMNLSYNDVTTGIDNDATFNGNISAIKWSTNLGLGISEPTQLSYKFTYDEMNRLKTSSYLEKTTTWTSLTDYRENLTYDLQGNINTLDRRGSDGAEIDLLTYQYDGNQLLRVTDSKDKTKGFIDGDNTTDDYVYDGNGNLVWDRNKGGIEIIANGGFDNSSTSWTITGATTRVTFSNSEASIAAGASSVELKQGGVVKDQPYVIVIDVERTAGSMSINLGGSPVGNISATGRYVYSLSSGSSHNEIRISSGNTFAGKIKSISVRGVTVIAYNYLNLPELVTRAGDRKLQYMYDAAGRKLQQVVSYNTTEEKVTDYNGEFFYENDTLRFVNHEEGRVVVNEVSPEYQYHLKDHLGNVRMTFTSKIETETFTATFEESTQSEEASTFDNYDPIDFDLFDHTDSASVYTYAQLLNGGNNSQIGLAKSISVMPGDTLKVEVYAKYHNATSNTANLTAFATALTSAFGLSAQSTGEAAVAYDALDSYGTIIAEGYDHSESSAPKAYLNILLFDRDHNFIDAAYKQIGANDDQTSTPPVKDPHGYLTREVIVRQPGYAYIFLSNENPTQVDVYFDDMKIEHIKSPVIQMDDYYPFGLAFNSYEGENSMDQNYQFNGKEEQDELDLDVLDFGWRTYDPAIARWNAIDGLTEKYISYSPYHFAGNNPIRNYDIDGNEFTDAAWVWVNNLITEINSKQASNNGKISEKREALAAGGLSQNKIDRLNRQIDRLESNNQELEIVRGETATLAASNQVYDVQEDDSRNEADATIAGAGFNFSNGNFVIGMPRTSSMSMFAHELKHAYQFEIGEYSVGPELAGANRNLLYDKHDEVAAYDRGALFGSKTYSVNSLPEIYSGVATGPVDSTTHPIISGLTNHPQLTPDDKRLALQRLANSSGHAFRVNGRTYYRPR